MKTGRRNRGFYKDSVLTVLVLVREYVRSPRSSDGSVIVSVASIIRNVPVKISQRILIYRAYSG